MTDPDRVLSATFTSSFPEQVAGARVVLGRTLSNWFLFALFVVMPCVGLSLAMLFAPEYVMSFLGLAIGGLLFWYFFPWYLVWLVRRGVSQPNGPHVVSIDQSAIAIAGPVARVEWKWPAVHRVKETTRFFLVYVAKSQATAIPKRAFSAEQCELFRAFCTEALGLKAEVARGA